MCYEGGCAVMTNEVPDIVVDLPTYEQVEDIKNVVDNTGGVMVDIDNKRYKSVVTSPYNFATGSGVDTWESFKNEMVAKFPEIASRRQMQNGYKVKLRDSIYMSFAGWDIAWFDASTMTVINAINTENHPDFKINTQYLWFEDDKYLYIRGALNTQFRLGVFDKETFNFIKTISLSGSDYSGGAVIDHAVVYKTPEIPFISGTFFLPSPFSAMIVGYKIRYGSGGVPTDFIYPGKIGSTNGANIFAIFEYKGYLYSFSTNGSNQRIYKYDFDAVNGTILTAATSELTVGSTGNIPRYSSWIQKLTSGDGTQYALMSFGSSSQIISIRLDTMLVSQNLYPQIYDVPTFDYENGTTMWVQPFNTGSVVIMLNGRTFETLFKFTMNPQTGYWTNKVYYVPILLTSFTNSGTFSRVITLGGYSFSLNDRLTVKYGVSEGVVLTPFKLIEGVQEV